MTKKQRLRMSATYSIIKTPVQANFHLNQGEVLVSPISRFKSAYIIKDNEKHDNYELALVPSFGIPELYEGDFKAIKRIIAEYEFFVLKGALLSKRKIGLFDRGIDWANRRLFNKEV